MSHHQEHPLDRALSAASQISALAVLLRLGTEACERTGEPISNEVIAKTLRTIEDLAETIEDLAAKP